MADSEPTEDRGEQEQVKWYDRLRGQMAIVGISIVVFLLVVGFVLDLYIAPTKPAHRKDVAQALGLITAGAAGAVGIFFTWRAQRLAREAQEDNQRSTQEQLRLSRQSQEQNQQSTQAQLKNAQEELRLTRQGQMTERFTQAIEQLGSDKLEIRLGGIYSLERTAQEEKNYHWPVMEVLTSYVRRHTAWNMEKATTPEPEIQAILDVIGRRSEDHRIDKDVEYGTIDLNNTGLQRAYLVGAYLVGADLRGAVFQKANFQGADLQKANFQGAGLQGANLQGAGLQGANFQAANLQTANLQGADLQAANLQTANLQGADLQGAKLQGATGMAQDQIEWTLGSSGTDLPEDLNPPELWSKSHKEQVTIVMEHVLGG